MYPTLASCVIGVSLMRAFAYVQAIRRCVAQVEACIAVVEGCGASLTVGIMTEQVYPGPGACHGARMAPCRCCRSYMDLLLTHQVQSLQHAREEYPVNALRNAALSMAETDLVGADWQVQRWRAPWVVHSFDDATASLQVLLLDVDFMVSSGTAARWASEDAAGALWQSCCGRCELLVLPAFQASSCALLVACSSGSACSGHCLSCNGLAGFPFTELCPVSTPPRCLVSTAHNVFVADRVITLQ